MTVELRPFLIIDERSVRKKGIQLSGCLAHRIGWVANHEWNVYEIELGLCARGVDIRCGHTLRSCA